MVAGVRRAFPVAILCVAALIAGSSRALAGPGVPAAPHVIATVPVGDGPSGVAVNSLTNRTYVADFRADSLSVIDEPTKTVHTIGVGSGPAAVGVNETTNRI